MHSVHKTKCQAENCWYQDNLDRFDEYCSASDFKFVVSRTDVESLNIDLNDNYCDLPAEVRLCEVCGANTYVPYGKKCDICDRIMYDSWIEDPEVVCRECVDPLVPLGVEYIIDWSPHDEEYDPEETFEVKCRRAGIQLTREERMFFIDVGELSANEFIRMFREKRFRVGEHFCGVGGEALWRECNDKLVLFIENEIEDGIREERERRRRAAIRAVETQNENEWSAARFIHQLMPTASVKQCTSFAKSLRYTWLDDVHGGRYAVHDAMSFLEWLKDYDHNKDLYD